jgi:hypothetical protein
MFWTDGTRSGCAGQWTSCCSSTPTENIPEILEAPGGCATMVMLNGEVLGAKATQCTSLQQLMCHSHTKVISYYPDQYEKVRN